MNRRVLNFSVILFGSVLLCLGSPAAVLGCPTCKDGLANSTAAGYAISILFMMGMPFLILTFWTIAIVRLRRTLAQTNSLPKLPLWGQSCNDRVVEKFSSSTIV